MSLFLTIFKMIFVIFEIFTIFKISIFNFSKNKLKNSKWRRSGEFKLTNQIAPAKSRLETKL